MGTIRSPGLTNGITGSASGTNKHSMLRCWYTVQKTKAKKIHNKRITMKPLMEVSLGWVIVAKILNGISNWRRKKHFVGLFLFSERLLCFMNYVVKQGLHLIVLEKCASVNGVYVTPWAPKPSSLILGGGASLQMVWGPSQGQTSWILYVETLFP